MNEWVIEVASKTPKKSGHSALTQDARHLGAKSIQAVETSQLYRFTGRATDTESQRIANDLLCDPIIEQWRLDTPTRAAGAKTTALTIDVWYKPGVTDVVGESVAKGIRDLGISSISAVRTGARYRLRGATPKETAERLARALFANILVQDYVIHADA